MKASFAFEPMPHEEAAGYIQDRSPMKREHFDRLRPELKARAFVVTGIEDLNVVRAIRDAIAEVPRGGDWEEAKAKVEAELAPWIHEDQVETRAKILLRYHVFQAYGAAHHQDMMADADVYTHWQYRATGDDKTRSSHLALDGLVLPAGHDFWKDHYPPWEYNCRCQVMPLMPEEVDEIREEDAKRDPAKRLVIEGAPLQQLEEQGRLDRGPNEIYDVRSARAKAASPDAVDKAFRNDPGDFSIPLDAVRQKTAPEDWWFFRDWAKEQELSKGYSVWDWLLVGEEKRAVRDLRATTARSGREKAALVDHQEGVRVERLGASDRVDVNALVEHAEKEPERYTLMHSHPNANPPSDADVAGFWASGLRRELVVTRDAIYELTTTGPAFPTRDIKKRKELEKRIEALYSSTDVQTYLDALNELGRTYGFRIAKR